MPQSAAPLWLDAAALRERVPVGAAIDALEAVLRAGPPPATPQRSAMAAGSGQLLAMPAAGPQGAGVKLVTIQPANAGTGLPVVQAVYVLFDGDTLAPVAVLDGTELTRIRTPAVTALATRHLARPDAERLVVFGAGVQAAAHVQALRAVLSLREVTVVAPGASADRLVAALAAEGLDARRGDPGSVAGADVVCACTTAAEPVFDGRDLAPGTHVNAIGAYQPHTRELDDVTLQRAIVVVEDRDAVLAEAGDLILPLASGAITLDHLAGDLRAAVTGPPLRRGPDDITVFKSVGVAWEDLAVAAEAVAQRW